MIMAFLLAIGPRPVSAVPCENCNYPESTEGQPCFQEFGAIVICLHFLDDDGESVVRAWWQHTA